MADADAFTTALVPSVSIEALVDKRNAIVERVREAHRLLVEAHQLGDVSLKDAYLGTATTLEIRAARLGTDRTFGYWCEDYGADDGASVIIRRVDAAAWKFLMDESGLKTFMDAAHRDAWFKKISDCDVPELTIENIRATFAQLYAARGDMFEDGVVAMFRELSHDYKTNKFVKLGKRLVVTRAVSKMRHWLSGPEHDFCNKVDDIIRVMSVLDNKPEPDHRNGTWNALNDARWMRDDSDCTEIALFGYVSVRGYKNGNAHLTFLRPDLVDGMNRILAKLHPDALPAAAKDS